MEIDVCSRWVILIKRKRKPYKYAMRYFRKSISMTSDLEFVWMTADKLTKLLPLCMRLFSNQETPTYSISRLREYVSWGKYSHPAAQKSCDQKEIHSKFCKWSSIQIPETSHPKWRDYKIKYTYPREFEFVSGLRHMHRYFSHIYDGT